MSISPLPFPPLAFSQPQSGCYSFYSWWMYITSDRIFIIKTILPVKLGFDIHLSPPHRTWVQPYVNWLSPAQSRHVRPISIINASAELPTWRRQREVFKRSLSILWAIYMGIWELPSHAMTCDDGEKLDLWCLPRLPHDWHKVRLLVPHLRSYLLTPVASGLGILSHSNSILNSISGTRGKSHCSKYMCIYVIEFEHLLAQSHMIDECKGPSLLTVKYNCPSCLWQIVHL